MPTTCRFRRNQLVNLMVPRPRRGPAPMHTWLTWALAATHVVVLITKPAVLSSPATTVSDTTTRMISTVTLLPVVHSLTVAGVIVNTLTMMPLAVNNPARTVTALVIVNFLRSAMAVNALLHAMIAAVAVMIVAVLLLVMIVAVADLLLHISCARRWLDSST